MANKLKIYACSGIGDAANEFDYWLDNTRVLKNTQAVNALYADIDAKLLELKAGSDKSRTIALLNDIDLYAVCLYFAQEYSGNAEVLTKAGHAIGSIVSKGMFSFDSADNAQRDKHLDELLDAVAAEMLNEAQTHNEAFAAWWEQNVMQLDKVGMTSAEQNAFKDCLKKAVKTENVGATDNPYEDENIGKYLTKAGNYFLYTYFTAEQLAKLPKVFTLKAIQQRRIYNYCKSFYVGLYGTEAKMQQVIRNGISREYNGATPEKVCAEIASAKNTLGIGFDWIALIKIIIAAIVTIVVGYISAIYQYKAQKEISENQSVSEKIINENVAMAEDLEGLETKSNTKKWLFAGAGLLGLWLLFKK